jgi:hypothetical protein
MSHSIVLAHTLPAHRLRSVLANGLLPALSRGARKVLWLHSFGRSSWAKDHVSGRHSVELDQVVRLRVRVPRCWLTRTNRKGVWTCARVIPPSMIMSFTLARPALASAAL